MTTAKETGTATGVPYDPRDPASGTEGAIPDTPGVSPPRSTGLPVAWRTVDDEDGLWSFRVYGDTEAGTVLILLPAMGVPARYYAPLVHGWLRENKAVVQADFLAGAVRPDPAKDERDGFAALVERCIPAILDTVSAVSRARPQSSWGTA